MTVGAEFASKVACDANDMTEEQIVTEEQNEES